MSAEERKKVAELQTLTGSGSGQDAVLRVLREYKGDLERAANHLLEEGAWWERAEAPAGAGGKRATRALGRLRARDARRGSADGRARADPFCDVKVKKVKKKEVRGAAWIRRASAFRDGPWHACSSDSDVWRRRRTPSR